MSVSLSSLCRLFLAALNAKRWRLERLGSVSNETARYLALLAGLSLILYFLAFVWPFSLLTWWMFPHLDISKITHRDPREGLTYMAAMAGLFGLYWSAARRALGRHSALTWGIVIAAAAAFCAALLFLYPVDAVDIFDNIIRGRMQVYYGANPFYVPPDFFPNDPVYRYIGWYNVTSAYGPGWELLSRVLSLLAGNSIIANVVVFKLGSVLAYAGTAALIGLLLRQYAPERALYGVLLLTWNPLVLYVTAGNGHNDTVMVFFIVLGLYLLARAHLTGAALALTAGALIKFIPALLLPLVLLAALKRCQTWPERLNLLLVTGGACVALVSASVIPYWHGGDMISLARRTEMFTTSLPTWLVIILEQNVHLNAALAELVASRVALIVLGVWLVRELLLVWRKDDGQALQDNWEIYVRAGLSILLFYLLVSCLWFQAWYVVWVVALSALLPASLITNGSILLSFAATWKMPIFDFYIMHGGVLPPTRIREVPLTAGTLGAVWLYLIYRWSKLKPVATISALRGQKRSSPGEAAD